MADTPSDDGLVKLILRRTVGSGKGGTGFGQEHFSLHATGKVAPYSRSVAATQLPTASNPVVVSLRVIKHASAMAEMVVASAATAITILHSGNVIAHYVNNALAMVYEKRLTT